MEKLLSLELCLVMPDILIIEDEDEIAKSIALYLDRESYHTQRCRDGVTALTLAQQMQPDLIVLDLMLPGINGLEVCARIRQMPKVKDPYILMLTSKGEEVDQLIGLSTGADDYVAKPCSYKMLVTRIQTLLRRSLRQGGKTASYRTQHFTADLDRRILYRHLHSEREEITLTSLEFELMATFMSYPGRVWTRAQLIEKLWGDDYFGDDRVVDTHVARLRKKIEADSANPVFVQTLIGIGYKFEDSKLSAA
ncbi:response regulator transcription factor [Microcoleus sp. FACHB-1515]|uniref:response regulator transcription factor n=2 Tax=Cyanophyceae TaxID=3028117 RepID=UPI001F551038|nr:response regulator transcription factor [Microcoleus sp. FACHB-1515]